MNRRAFLFSLPFLATIPVIKLISLPQSVSWTPDQYSSTRAIGRIWFCWRDLQSIEIAWLKVNGQWGQIAPVNMRRPTILRLGRYEDNMLCGWSTMSDREKKICSAFRETEGRLMGDIPTDWRGQWRFGIRRMQPWYLRHVKVEIVDSEHHCELI